MKRIVISGIGINLIDIDDESNGLITVKAGPKAKGLILRRLEIYRFLNRSKSKLKAKRNRKFKGNKFFLNERFKMNEAFKKSAIVFEIKKDQNKVRYQWNTEIKLQ